ncbi:hypothetical protein ACHAW5_010911 [Stephanodiscus triporus]|uniref:BZIP domain-containing protein n=1 Tax=Stephanodiscus triporus TaxID=2934178 RepID=A0ABD3N8A7_9STRA
MALGNDCHGNGNGNNDSPTSVGTSESVMDAMASAMMADVGADIIQPALGLEGGKEMGGVDDYEPPTNRQRRRSNSIHWETSQLPSSLRCSPPPSFRASAGAALSAAAAVASSSSPSSSPDGGSSHHRRRTGVLPQCRSASFMSATLFGGHGGVGYSHSSGSLHSEGLHSEGCSGESDSGCGSPPAVFFGGGTPPVAAAFGVGGGGGTTTGWASSAAAAVGSAATTHASFAAAAAAAASRPNAGGNRTSDKRQRRLERNRESARVSRRRRKHYLEELECRVSRMSEEMDRGRMAHASSAVRTIRGMRSGTLDDAEGLLSSRPGWRDPSIDGPPPPVKKSSGIHHNVVVAPRNANDEHPAPRTTASTSSLERAANALVANLSRASNELQIVQTFMKQHLLSLVQPTPTRFVLWLSLQDDGFYRGGRSASERLSAARIGERLLHGGTDRAAPNTTMMWPLVCHEISISYEQEEKVRGIQRTILSNSDGWIHRHTALATRKVIEGVHDVICGAQAAAGNRERSLMRILTPEQRVKFLGWARRRGDVIKRLAEIDARGGRKALVPYGGHGVTTTNCGDDEYRTSPDRHIAANLYIINHLLTQVKQRQQQQQQQRGASATPAVVVHPTKLKKLSRRPSFESLAGLQAAEDAHNAKLSREGSFSSSGSLKRSLASMASLGDGSCTDSIDPNATMFSNGGNNAVTIESAQSAGQAAVMSVLRDVLPIVPREAWYNPPSTSATGSTFHSPTAMTPQPSPLPQACQPSMFATAPSSEYKPKASQHAQQPQRWKNPHSIPMQHAKSVSRAGISAQPQHQRPLQSDILDVDDIPMPTPVSVLLRTSDDYLVSSPVYEQEELQLDALVSSSSGFAFGAADGFSMPSSNANTNTGLNRHQSAPQLEAFTQATDPTCPSLLASQHMAMIPELEPVMSHSGFAIVDHGAADFSVPEQVNSSSFYNANACLPGYRHQSAPQFDTFATSSDFHRDPSSLPSPHMAVMPEVAYTVSGGNDIDIIREFEMLEELNFTNQIPTAETDDWAIGEGFDDDMDVEGAA